MILIFSDADDLSTDFVIDYLNLLDAKYIRINFIDLIENYSRISFELETNILKIDDLQINLSEIKTVWFRKIGYMKKSTYYREYQESFRSFPPKDILAEYLTRETYGLIITIFRHINEDAYWITNLGALNINKLDVLTIAKKCGLKTPFSFITNNKNDFSRLAKDRSVISKSIRESVFFSTKKHYYQMLTQRINGLEEIPDLFFPSLIQDNIDKDFELRIFYLEENFYPMAIFSQNDEQTSVDFRNYNLNEPNRNVPCILPDELKTNLYAFTKKINLNCGSIDMIKDKNGNYIFLEVNPNGQFGMVDIPCNYKLNRKIAEHIVSKN